MAICSEDYPYKEVLDLMANRCLAKRTNAWTDTDLQYSFALDAPAVVDFDYALTGSLNPISHLLCRLHITRPSIDWFPREGRSIVGNTQYFTVEGQVSGVLEAGSYSVAVQCRTPATASIDPGSNDFHDRYLRLRVTGR